MTALIIAGLTAALLAALIAARPLNYHAGNDETLLSLRHRRDTLEQQIAATRGDDERGDLDPAFATDEKSRLELELLQVLEALESASQPIERETRGGAFSAYRAGALFLLMALVGGGLYYQSQQHWWQAHLSATISSEQPVAAGAAAGGVPMMADGQPDIGAMVERLATRLEQFPDDGPGWKRLGRSYWVMNEFQKSTDAYAHAAELLPDDFTLIQGYAMSRMQLEAELQREVPLAPAIEAMVAQLRARVDANPDDPQGYRAIAAVYAMVGRRDSAAQVYEQILQRQPGDLETAVTAASNQFIEANGELTDAVTEAYERIAGLDPSNQSVIWYRGYAAYKNKQWQQVIDHWQPLLERLPAAGVDYQRIAEALTEARQHLSADSP